jgi:hypothetical protein
MNTKFSKKTRFEIDRLYEKRESLENQLSKDKDNPKIIKELITVFSAIAERAETEKGFFTAGGCYQTAGQYLERLGDYVGARDSYKRALINFKKYDNSEDKLSGAIESTREVLDKVRRIAAVEKLSEGYGPVRKYLIKRGKLVHSIILVLLGLLFINRNITGNVIGNSTLGSNIISIIFILMGFVLLYYYVKKEIYIRKKENY